MTNLPSFDISGQVALVTGASSGIGEHFAEILAAAGAKVAAAARRADRLAELADASRRMAAPACRSPATSPIRQSIVAAIATAEDRLGPLSILVNNAGVVVSKPFFEHTEEDWDYVIDTNLKGAWLAAREFAHHLVENKRPGRIVNISSILGFPHDRPRAGLLRRQSGPDAPDARAGDGAGALWHSRQRAGAGLYRDRFQSRIFSDRRRQGADRPHPDEADRSGAGPRRGAPVPGLAGERLCHRRGDLGRWRPRRCRDLIRQRLAAFSGRGERRELVRVSAPELLAGGAIQENWGFEAEFVGGACAGRHALVLRTDAATGVASSLDRIEEFAVQKAAFAAGVTVAEPLWACADPEVIGRPFFVMRRVAGTAQGRQITADPALEPHLPAIAARLGEELARIQTIRPPRPDLAFLPHIDPAAAHRRVPRLSRPASQAAAGARMGDTLARNAYSGAPAAGAVPPRFPHRQLHAATGPN